MPIKAYYNASVSSFLKDDAERILGVLTAEHHHALEEPQRWAWLRQLSILKHSLTNQTDGRIFLEFYIPRMGKRADAVLIAASIIFVIEFKVGASGHASIALEQVEDYALDLKNFHEGSHSAPIVPVLVSTDAESRPIPGFTFADDLVASPIGTNKVDLGRLIDVICAARPFPKLDIDAWMTTGYKPTPTIVQAEDVASEFAVQGLELDWVGVCWDGDYYHKDGRWLCQAFKGTKWQAVSDEFRRLYLKNSYRVILTRARQGMVLFVPKGDTSDRTRPASFYDGTFEYLRAGGIPVLD